MKTSYHSPDAGSLMYAALSSYKSQSKVVGKLWIPKSQPWHVSCLIIIGNHRHKSPKTPFVATYIK